MADSKVSLPAQLAEHLSTPLYRNAYLLTISSGGSAALGLVFWSLAARYYPPEVVGLDSALLAAMLLLAGIATFSLNNVLIRFIQPAGRQASRLIALAYAISVTASVPVSLIFLAGAAAWLPGLRIVDTSLVWTIAFTASVAAWCMFALQDFALTGLRQAQWIPIENILFGLLKIGLLIVFARYLTQFGIFAAWNIPVLISLAPINYIIFWRLIPQHAAATGGQGEPLVPRQIVSYAAGNYLGTLFGLAANNLLPILVASVAGTATNAYFFVPWTIVTGLQLWALNMTTSLTVEAALEPRRLAAYLRRVVIQMLRLLLPAAAVIFLAAPLLLRLFGPDYSAHGTQLLRWLALSAIPNAIVVLGLSLARVENRSRMVALIQGMLSGLGLGLSAILLPRLGLAGVGLAWLASQSLVALLVAGTLLRPWLRTWRAATAPLDGLGGQPL
jgi:O-antigen/teichoic acid export membrane protein